MKDLTPEFEAMLARFPPGFASSLVLPCLRRIQEERGYVADPDIEALVACLGVPRIQIEEVLSFYSQFRRRPIGRWHLEVCHNVSCSMRGAHRLLAHLERKLGIAVGETTPDARCTLTSVECIGSCGTAPAMMCNGRYVENLTQSVIDTLLEELD